MTDQLPRMVDLMAPAVTALVAARPRAAKHIYAGRYGNVMRGLEAQASLVRAYLMSEIKAASLRAEGQALVEYLQDFFAEIEDEPLAAVGEATITRSLTNTNPAGGLTEGVIRRGQRVTRQGDPSVTPVVEQAEYTTLDDAIFDTTSDATVDNGDGTYTHTQDRAVGLLASRTGEHANVPIFDDGSVPTTASVDGELFDSSSIFTASIACAGGMTEVSDDQLRQLAPHAAQGQFGPNVDAGLAGAFSYAGVRYSAYVRGPTTAIDTLYVADSSWASSDGLSGVVKAFLRDQRWLGFGARLRVSRVQNVPVVLKPTCVVRNPVQEADKSALNESLSQAARLYFDERPDWYTWSTDALRAALTAASRDVLTVSSALVQERDGTALTEPANTITEGASVALHYYVVGVQPTYVVPS